MNMASLAVEHTARARSEAPSRGSDDLIDTRALTAELEQLAKAHVGSEKELRSVIAQRLKAALADGRAKAEQLLLTDRHGRRCAERLCRMEDEIIGILYAFARNQYPSENPSEGERMAIIATGGMAAACRRPARISICCFSFPTSKPLGASRLRKRFFTLFGIRG